MGASDLSDPKQIQAAWQDMARKMAQDPALEGQFFDNPVRVLKSAGLSDEAVVEILLEEYDDQEEIRGYVAKYFEEEERPTESEEVSSYLFQISFGPGTLDTLLTGNRLAGGCLCTVECCYTKCRETTFQA
jgi:hypothetical protein